MTDDTITPESAKRIAMGTLCIAVLSIPLFALFRVLDFEQGVIGCFMFGFSTSTLWAPALLYAGIRTGSRWDMICGGLSTLTSAFWFWWLMFS